MSHDEGEFEERVGYRHPPRATRFRKGQSGNPSGKRRMAVPLTLQDAANAILARKVKAQIGGKVMTLTNSELMLEAIVQRAQRKGDVQAFKALLPFLQASGAFGTRDPTIEEMAASLTPDEVGQIEEIRRELAKHAGEPGIGSTGSSDPVDSEVSKGPE